MLCGLESCLLITRPFSAACSVRLPSIGRIVRVRVMSNQVHQVAGAALDPAVSMNTYNIKKTHKGS